MNKDPIKVNIYSDLEDEDLHPMSRVNLGKSYPVEHNVKVFGVGKIARPDLEKFLQYCQMEQEKDDE